jgi:penicillin-binding protein-related factor A (putative recombinase)
MTHKRRGAETGSGFQDAVNRTNEAYEKLGRACITRKAIPGKYLLERGEARRGLAVPPINLSSHGTQARLSSTAFKNIVKENNAKDWRKFIPESKAEPDYGGVLAPDGRAIFYDAKTTRREVLDFDNLHAHQIEFLERTADMGAIAGFLVEFSTHQEVYFLPIQIANHLALAPPGKGFVIFDYLAAIAVQEQRYKRDYSRFKLPPPPARKTKLSTAV